jgi:uncharacterized membrane protein YfcA
MLRIILTVLVGIISGIVGGAFGLGGSVIMLPALLLLNIIPNYKTAVGTVLLFITYFLAAKYGAKINKIYSNQVLKYWTAVLFFLIGFYFLWSGYNNVE